MANDFEDVYGFEGDEFDGKADSLNLYLAKIEGFQRLGRLEIEGLLEKKLDEGSRRMLVESYLGKVANIALDYSSEDANKEYFPDAMELIEIANVSLSKSIDAFEGNSCDGFEEFLCHGIIYDFDVEKRLRELSVRIPSPMTDDLREVCTSIVKLEKKIGHFPNLHEIYEALGDRYEPDFLKNVEKIFKDFQKIEISSI